MNNITLATHIIVINIIYTATNNYDNTNTTYTINLPKRLTTTQQHVNTTHIHP